MFNPSTGETCQTKLVYHKFLSEHQLQNCHPYVPSFLRNVPVIKIRPYVPSRIFHQFSPSTGSASPGTGAHSTFRVIEAVPLVYLCMRVTESTISVYSNVYDLISSF